MIEKKVHTRRRVFGLSFWCRFLMVIGIVAVTIAVIRNGIVKKNVSKYEDHGVAVMEIDLNGVTLAEIDGGDKEIKYEGNKVVVFDGKESEYGGVEIKGRGNGTWLRGKKPYQIKFGERVDLLGLGKGKKWYLLANELDGTNLRMETASYLEEMLGMKYIYDGDFVELYVDGEYRGLYYLTHAVKIGKNEVDLRDPLGILVELDNMYGNLEEYHETSDGNLMIIKDLVDDSNSQLAMANFMTDYNAFEKAVAKKDYNLVKELVDVESWAQYYLLSEFTVNPDAYWTSFFFYKDGKDDKIHVGPAWDFDLAFANRRWGSWLGEIFYSPTETMVRKNELLPNETYEFESAEEKDWHDSSEKIATIMYDMMEMPEFEKKVSEIFMDKLSGRKGELLKAIRQSAKIIYDASVVDEDRWSNNGVKAKLEEEFGDEISAEYGFELETEVMLDWIDKRYDYFEQVYGRGLQNNRILL